ncbi:hypothetical protein F0249_19170 [Vibrio sp. 03-59-1]|uniref:hypothetical protein n=1 Tax=Vibrio sp. 03-59-1 TaxID=2607607 RepID=UPI00149345E3|nr:hypothetical protein [Vibrio sp. 03-59-1]NOH85911.1 hypothetical protein [Vibrio sp. 03-59-1]
MEVKTPVGFLPCRKCQAIKEVFQGKGRNAETLYAKCDCGTDTRKGKNIQSEFAQHMEKEAAQIALDMLITPEPPEVDTTKEEILSAEETTQEHEDTPPESKPTSLIGWGVLGALALTAFGLKKLSAGAA